MTYQYPRPPIPAEKEARKALLGVGASWELDATGRVSVVHMGSHPERSQFTDNDLVHLTSLKGLRGLNLGYSGITDAGLEHLQGLTGLRWIYLYGTRVTDDGLKHLDKMQEMESLVLANKTFTDTAFEHIVKHPPPQTAEPQRHPGYRRGHRVTAQHAAPQGGHAGEHAGDAGGGAEVAKSPAGLHDFLPVSTASEQDESTGKPAA
jgi:hypothetical protein